MIRNQGPDGWCGSFASLIERLLSKAMQSWRPINMTAARYVELVVKPSRQN